MHRADPLAVQAVTRLTPADLGRLGAVGTLSRLLGCDRVEIHDVRCAHAGVQGFGRFAAYGTIHALAHRGGECDMVQVDFDACGSAVGRDYAVDRIDLLDDLDMPVPAVH